MIFVFLFLIMKNVISLFFFLSDHLPIIWLMDVNWVVNGPSPHHESITITKLLLFFNLANIGG